MSSAAHTAIDILKGVRAQLGPRSVAFWVFPNVVLTLSGERAYADAVLYHPDAAQRDKWLQEIKTSLGVVEEDMPLRWREVSEHTARGTDPYVGYEFLSEQGVSAVASHTRLLGTDAAITGATPQAIQENMIRRLQENPTLSGFSQANLEHIAFGILAGYPDQAIFEAATYWQREDEDGAERFGERLVDADIRGADYYSCPQPVYQYPRQLMASPDIMAHEQRWSQVLTDFYTSDFHKELRADPDFAEQIAQLTRY